VNPGNVNLPEHQEESIDHMIYLSLLQKKTYGTLSRFEMTHGFRFTNGSVIFILFLTVHVSGRYGPSIPNAQDGARPVTAIGPSYPRTLSDCVRLRRRELACTMLWADAVMTLALADRLFSLKQLS
jgi:hypothetical protein